jgi:hypothetical protein
LRDINGNSVLRHYGGSVVKLMATVYPEYEWLPWKFEHSPKNYWENVSNQRRFMDWAAKELNVKDMSDWYNVSVKVLLLEYLLP